MIRNLVLATTLLLAAAHAGAQQTDGDGSGSPAGAGAEASGQAGGSEAGGSEAGGGEADGAETGGGGQPGPGGAPPPPPTVTVMEVEPQDVILTATLPGRIVASAVAEVRPQVAGILTARLFEEGAHVEEGDILYEIDPATYDAAVAQAMASLEQARASAVAAEKEEQRVKALVERRVDTQQNLDQAVAARDVARASIAVAEAQLTTTKIDQARTTIRAPLSGEIGLAMTTQGALVTASQDSPLAVIRNIETVYVDVTQSATDVLRFRRDRPQEAEDAPARSVTLRLADGEPYPETGVLRAAEPYVDPQTGVVVLRMQFDNPDGLLLPGMYVRVEVETQTLKDAFVVPQAAVQRDRRGRPTVLVVGADDVVESRGLTVEQAQGANWIVSEGLSAGDRIVTEGSQKAMPGATVTPAPPRAEAEADGSGGAAAPQAAAGGASTPAPQVAADGAVPEPGGAGDAPAGGDAPADG